MTIGQGMDETQAVIETVREIRPQLREMVEALRPTIAYLAEKKGDDAVTEALLPALDKVSGEDIPVLKAMSVALMMELLQAPPKA